MSNLRLTDEANVKRQEFQEQLGNKKVYHMDIDAVLGREKQIGMQGTAGVGTTYKRFSENAETQPHGALINQYCDEIHDNLNVSSLISYITIILNFQDLKQRIDQQIENNQNDFFTAFKNKMNVILKDMQELKQKANVEKIKAK